MQDELKPQQELLEEFDLSNEHGPKRPIFISKALDKEFKEKLIALLRAYADVFAWHYEEMPGLDTMMVTHRLDVFPNSRAVKQSQRKYHPDLEQKIKEEVEKLRKAGFIRPIQYPDWLANIVPVKKKNGQVRVCVDFRDINKACPKDELPLPHIDTLAMLHRATKCSLLWMDLADTIK